MLPRSELKKLARSRLEESKVLFRARKFDGAAYLCGYAVELALKARICATLKWTGFPETRREFEPFASFKTHKLDVLLSLSGIQQRTKTSFLAEWSSVVAWEPEVRYKPVGTASKAETQLMLSSAEVLLRVI